MTQRITQLTHEQIKQMVDGALDKILTGKAIDIQIEQGDIIARVNDYKRDGGHIEFKVEIERLYQQAPTERTACVDVGERYEAER